MLAQRVNGWLHDEAARRQAAHMAREVVDRLGGALDKTVLALEPYLMQLRLGQGQNHLIGGPCHARLFLRRPGRGGGEFLPQGVHVADPWVGGKSFQPVFAGQPLPDVFGGGE